MNSCTLSGRLAVIVSLLQTASPWQVLSEDIAKNVVLITASCYFGITMVAVATGVVTA